MPISSMDLVANILDNKPAEVAANFHELMMNKIGDVIASQKRELAATLFGGVAKDQEETPETPETTDNENVEATA